MFSRDPKRLRCQRRIIGVFDATCTRHTTRTIAAESQVSSRYLEVSARLTKHSDDGAGFCDTLAVAGHTLVDAFVVFLHPLDGQNPVLFQDDTCNTRSPSQSWPGYGGDGVWHLGALLHERRRKSRVNATPALTAAEVGFTRNHFISTQDVYDAVSQTQYFLWALRRCDYMKGFGKVIFSQCKCESDHLNTNERIRYFAHLAVTIQTIA